jgi:hypothetical protein
MPCIDCAIGGDRHCISSSGGSCEAIVVICQEARRTRLNREAEDNGRLGETIWLRAIERILLTEPQSLHPLRN